MSLATLVTLSGRELELEPRRRAERALLSVVQVAYLAGVSTRRVDDLVRALAIDGLSKSEVSRMCTALDAEVEAFRNRPKTDCAFPHLLLDATYVKVRGGPGRINGGAGRASCAGCASVACTACA